MPDTEEIDGDVYVSPRHLAGRTFTGDPAQKPLLALGFDLRRRVPAAAHRRLATHGQDGRAPVFPQPGWNRLEAGTLPTSKYRAFLPLLTARHEANR